MEVVIYDIDGDFGAVMITKRDLLHLHFCASPCLLVAVNDK